MKARQISFVEIDKHYRKKKTKKGPGRPRVRPITSFGGSYSKNYNPMSARPIDIKRALHMVLRSSSAKGARSFKNNRFERPIWDIIRKHAAKNDIRIYEYANAGNHLHLLMRVKDREQYRRFIRAITGLIARLVMGIERGPAQSTGVIHHKQKFWDGRPFTRIVRFGRYDFDRVKAYLLRNTLETIGWVPYISRSRKLNPEWRKFWVSMASVP